MLILGRCKSAGADAAGLGEEDPICGDAAAVDVIALLGEEKDFALGVPSIEAREPPPVDLNGVVGLVNPIFFCGARGLGFGGVVSVAAPPPPVEEWVALTGAAEGAFLARGAEISESR